MKILGRLATAVVAIVAALWVAAEVLPRLLPIAAAIFGMVVIGRLVFFYTRRW